MGIKSVKLKSVVTALFAALCFFHILSPRLAQAEEPIQDLYQGLGSPVAEIWQKAESEIRESWNRSGSATMDLLLERGQLALETGDIAAAVEHLTALTDHAPNFAEGWHSRARAYFAAGLWGPAIDDLQQTLVLEPRHFDAMIGLAVILGQTGREQDALSLLRAAQTIHPNHPDIGPELMRLESVLAGQTI